MTNNRNFQGSAFDRCQSCDASDEGLGATLEENITLTFSERGFQSRYVKGDELLSQGEPSDRVGIIGSGMVKIVLITESGEEHLLQLLHAGELVGDLLAIENAFSWEAATDTVICWMTRRSLEALLGTAPILYRDYLAAVARQLARFQMSVAAMRGRSTLQRLAYWLIEQTPDTAGDGSPRVSIFLTRRDLASLLDMTVETLCRGLHQLANRGVIDLLAPDLVEVSDRAKLKVLAKCHDDRVTSALRGGGRDAGAAPPRVWAPQLVHDGDAGAGPDRAIRFRGRTTHARALDDESY